MNRSGRGNDEQVGRNSRAGVGRQQRDGETIARIFAAEGARVILTGRSQSAAAGMAESIGHRATGLALEVSDRASWQAAIGASGQTCRRLDILVNRAGASVGGSIEDTSDENWRMHMSTNLDGAFHNFRCAGHASTLAPYAQGRR
jgi:NADP-dependent 3-hydroxy acid dehydrogenase YdfG